MLFRSGGANFYGNMMVESTTTAATGVGGGIVFSGAYNGTTTVQGGGIKLLKSNGTAGDYSFGLGFYTRLTGTAGALAANLDSSGNLGLGVTPSGSWATNWKAIQIGQGAALASQSNGNNTQLYSNVVNGTTNYLYMNNGYEIGRAHV